MTDPVSIRRDFAQFDECQLGFVDSICKSIKVELENAGVDPELQMELTTQIAFSVCCIIDGSTQIERAGEPIRPCLTFAVNEEYTELLSSGGATSCHEYAVGFSEDLFIE